MSFRFILAVVLITLLPACSAAGQSLQPSEPPRAGTVQTDSFAASPDLSTKSIGTPVPGWENIPIMPGAYNGEPEDLVYLYSVKEAAADVEEYYLVKMDVNGWELTSRQTLEASPSSGPATILEFRKNDLLLNVMLVNVPEENATAVLLSQFGP